MNSSTHQVWHKIPEFQSFSVSIPNRLRVVPICFRFETMNAVWIQLKLVINEYIGRELLFKEL